MGSALAANTFGSIFNYVTVTMFIMFNPLSRCASIQAIETDSKSDTEKLITYWVCLSLILLYEHAFAKLLEWLPSWPYIKLIIVGCLVIPHFGGSFYVYKKLVHPCMSVDPHSILDWFIKLKEFLEQDNLPVDVKREAKETVPDAVENLIAFGTLTALKPKLEHAKDAKQESDAVAIMEKNEATSTKQVRQIKPDFALSGNRTCASVEIKEMTETMIADRDLLDIPPSKTIRENWTCDGCQVTTASETDNTHLQGKQHEGTSEVLEAENQTSNAKTHASVETHLPLESKEMDSATLAGTDIPDRQHPKDVQKMWICSVCQETTTSAADFILHFQGKQHVDACEKLKGNEETLKSKTFSASAAVSAPPHSSCDLPEKLQSNNRQPPWNFCAVCEVTVTSKMDLISHFQGRRHEGALEKLKVKIETSRSNIFPTMVEKEMTGSDLPDQQNCKHVQIPWICGICRTTIKDEASVVSHLQGKRHLNACERAKSLIQTLKRDVSPASTGKKSNSSEEAEKYRSGNVSSPKNTSSKVKKQGKQENMKGGVVEVRNAVWRCTICKISCNSEGNMDSHLNGSKHLANWKVLNGAGGSGLA
ncbi:conserved hypothetical protein [Ricinus communis]|uniref:C2H2-type domain-containing protein n=1 Tax=Ricinus communis TaxID=3988 RepID=B9RX75_RICCO|nr:conserved hypothetical protein [Ricinus communis]